MKLSLSIALNILLLTTGSYFVIKRLTYKEPKIQVEQYATDKPEETYHYKYRASLFKSLPADTGEIVFTGNSIAHNGEWSELLQTKVLNRAIGGERTSTLLLRISDVTRLKPSKVFIEIGTNDLSHKVPIQTILHNYQTILDSLKPFQPSIISVIPRNDYAFLNDSILALNDKLKELALKNKASFIDVYDSLSNTKYFSEDNVHLNGEGYMILGRIIKRAI